MTVLIAPSLFASDFASLSTEIAAAERGGADLLHCDVMDGHFVPNLTMGPPVIKAIKRVARVPLDVHLMIENPDAYVEAFVEAGASMLSVHAEAVYHLHRTVHFIKSLGVKAGVAINPATPVVALEEIAGDVDPNEVERHALGAMALQRRQAMASLLERYTEAMSEQVDVIAHRLRRLPVAPVSASSR